MVEMARWVFNQFQGGSQPFGLLVADYQVDFARRCALVIINQRFPVCTQLNVANPLVGRRYQDDTVST